MMTIEQMQDAISEKGYQWIEHIFNDGRFNNCILKFTKHKSPTYFSRHVLGDFGWGRFDRKYCWEMAYDHIVKSDCADKIKPQED